MYKILIYFITFIALSGCVSTTKHEHTSGSIVALDSKTEGHVCITSNGTIIGELVDVYQVICTKNMTEIDQTDKKNKVHTYSTTCKRIKKGTAKVIENMDKHFSKIRSEEGFELKEGFIIETAQPISK